MALARSRQQQKKSGTKPENQWIDSEPGLVLLDSSLNPIAFNREAASILSGPSQSMAERKKTLKIPEKILEKLRLRNSSGFSTEPICVNAAKRSYAYRASVLESCDGTSPALLMLVLQRHSSIEEAVYETATQFNLTDREREAMEGILKGLNGRELAKAMKISPNTVKAYMHLIMVKMGVATRAAIITKILEHTRGNGTEVARADAQAAGKNA